MLFFLICRNPAIHVNMTFFPSDFQLCFERWAFGRVRLLSHGATMVGHPTIRHLLAICWQPFFHTKPSEFCSRNANYISGWLKHRFSSQACRGWAWEWTGQAGRLELFCAQKNSGQAQNMPARVVWNGPGPAWPISGTFFGSPHANWISSDSEIFHFHEILFVQFCNTKFFIAPE